MGVLAEVSGDSWKAGWEVQQQQESSPGLLATATVLSTILKTPTLQVTLGMPLLSEVKWGLICFVLGIESLSH